MSCPKCGSSRIVLAPDEAPPWATSWTKCFACGKRWNLEGGQPKTKGDEEGTEELDVSTSPKRTGEDIVKLVMDLSRKQPAVLKKETTMVPTCNRPNCTQPRADDSVRCVRHRDAQKRSNENYAKLHPPAKAKKERAPTLPATRSHAPITLAEPRIVNPAPGRAMNLDGNVLTVLDGLIATREAELVMLRGTKEILEARA